MAEQRFSLLQLPPQHLAINGNQLAPGEIIHRLYPADKALLKLNRIKSGNNACDGVMNG